MPEIKECWITTRQASPTDPGAGEIGFYFIENGVLKMCDESGKPNGVMHKLEHGGSGPRSLVAFTGRSFIRPGNRPSVLLRQAAHQIRVNPQDVTS